MDKLADRVLARFLAHVAGTPSRDRPLADRVLRRYWLHAMQTPAVEHLREPAEHGRPMADENKPDGT